MPNTPKIFTSLPDLPPPVSTTGLLGWLRINLFSSVANSIVTVGIILGLMSFIPDMVAWLFINADWIGESRRACEFENGDAHNGACWVFIGARFNQFIFGLYPSSEYWRVLLAVGIFVAWLLPLRMGMFRFKKHLVASLLTLYPVVAYFLLKGGIFGLEAVNTDQWGGLTLTLVLSGVGMTVSLPCGILLALGRRSKMPLVKSICVIFIEFIRGVPLITLLFMASVMLPLFLSDGMNFDKLMRALVAISLFQSAYMAEVVRGGLQAISKGQYEAADAMGLNFAKANYLVIMPQALKLVIPGIVNTFIALFKDTSLVLIIGMFDLAGMAKLAFKDPNWLGYSTEAYIFAALIFWIFCFSMSRYSQAIERRLDTEHRN